MKLWMAVTDDKYEFPIYVADTPSELSKQLNIKMSTIYQHKRDLTNKFRANKGYKIVMVNLEDEDVETI